MLMTVESAKKSVMGKDLICGVEWFSGLNSWWATHLKDYFHYFLYASTNLSVISMPQVLYTTRTEFYRLWTMWLWLSICCVSGPTRHHSGCRTFALFLRSTRRLCSTSRRKCSCCTARRHSRMFWASTEILRDNMLIFTNWYRWVLFNYSVSEII